MDEKSLKEETPIMEVYNKDKESNKKSKNVKEWK